IGKGRITVMLGPGGAGKRTLLNIVGFMDKATSGTLTLGGESLEQANEQKLLDIRRSQIGFVFQFYNLMPNLTALENIEIATELSKEAIPAIQALEWVGLKERAHHFPSQMSGGEQQRVSIARAIAKKPQILLCDEPTGALDYTTGKQVLRLLKDIQEKTGTTLILITHNQAIAQMAHTVIRMRSGEITEIHGNPSPIPPEEIEW
ncbi:MAG: ABC transporter ATP-binding protein, partial [Clostridia bacterium]|nr:ABC transporter ATP-binding protein [Clostridia bacterium]